MYTTTDSSTPFAPGYGQPIGTRVIGCTALWPRAAGFDTHEMGLDISFSGCTVIGGGRCGFQLRAVRNSVTDCVVTDCVGEAVYHRQFGAGRLHQEPARPAHQYRHVSGSESRGSRFDLRQRPALKRCRCRVELCGGPAIEAYTGATGFDYSRNLIRNPCQLTATNKNAIFVNTSAVIDVDMHHNRITVTDGLATTGIKATSSNISGFVTGNNVRGVTTPFNFGGAIQATGNLPATSFRWGRRRPLPSRPTPSTCPQSPAGSCRCSAKAARPTTSPPSNGGVTGQKITFKRGAAVTITVKHGTGNIQLQGRRRSRDRRLVRQVVLRKDGSTWVEDGI
jgi:hypothetical protein